MAGSGKSITLLTITEQALRSGAGVAFIDFKGSIDTAQRLAAIADHLGVPFYNFSLVDGDALANIRWDFFSWNKGPAQARATRITSIIHALVLVVSMFLLAPVMSSIPLAALAGVVAIFVKL